MNLNTTSARPEDDAYNIQCGHLTSRTSTNGPRSNSPSPMDNSSPPSEVDYAERVAANCNMDIEITDPSLPSGENVACFPFSLEKVPNSATSSNIDISTDPLSPKLSHTARTFQQIPVYGMEISRRHLCSAPTNSSTATLVTSRAP